MLNDFSPVLNPHEILASLLPELANFFEEYRQGILQLRVYRNSTPHNWWLEPVNKRGDTAYHWPEYYSPQKAFFAFARKLESTGPKVTYGGWMRGSDEGMPIHDTWVFDQALYEACVERWKQAVLCAKSFNDLSGSRAPDVWALSAYARQIARFLKRGGRGVMYNRVGGPLGNWDAVVDELTAMGFATVTPEGYYYATEALKKQVIPREEKYFQQQNATC